MANEYLLKMIVNGLENLAVDNETLCEHLNLRAIFLGFEGRFKSAKYLDPAPPYPTKVASQARASELVGRIADNNAFAVLSLGGTPASPTALDRDDFDDADILRLMIDWGTLQAGVYKAMIQLYGRRPAPAPDLPSPGAASEERLWAEIVAWFEKIAADTDLYDAVQEIVPKDVSTRKRPAALHRLVRLEQGVHRVTLDTLQIAGLLPYHLYHAAHATRAGARARRKPQ